MSKKVYVAPNEAEAAEAPTQVTMSDDIFQGNQKIMIKQEFAAIELCSIEAPNKYRVSVPNGEEEGPNIFLYIDEESGCFERVCCSKNRTLTLNVHQGASSGGPTVMAMHKPFHLQGCCCMRPAFTLFSGPKDSGNQIGKIEDPCRCCKLDQKIIDKSGTIVYTTYGSICQLGLYCPCCASADFQILKDGQEVGLISKRPLTCCECIQKTNRFIVDFPKDADSTQKQLIFAATMLADLQYFEKKRRKNNGGQ